jgi:hypothetical protein
MSSTSTSTLAWDQDMKIIQDDSSIPHPYFKASQTANPYFKHPKPEIPLTMTAR